MLPQANLASTWSDVRFACSPRNSCDEPDRVPGAGARHADA